MLLGLVFLFLARTASAQEPPTVETPSPSPISSETSQRQGNWQNPEQPNLSELWESLKAELEQSEQDWQKQAELLLQLQIETEELQSLLMQSTEQSQNLKEAQTALILENEKLKNYNKILFWSSGILGGLLAGAVVIILVN
jgi:hypothetical protein